MKRVVIIGGGVAGIAAPLAEEELPPTCTCTVHVAGCIGAELAVTTGGATGTDSVAVLCTGSGSTISSKPEYAVTSTGTWRPFAAACRKQPHVCRKPQRLHLQATLPSGSTTKRIAVLQCLGTTNVRGSTA